MRAVRRSGDFDDAALGCFSAPAGADAQGIEQRPERRQFLRMIVVAADHHRVEVALDDFGEAVEHEPLGLGGRSDRVEQVARHQQAIDALARRDVEDLGDDAFLFVDARASAQRFADVPVAGMEESHCFTGSAAGFLKGLFPDGRGWGGGKASAYQRSSA